MLNQGVKLIDDAIFHLKLEKLENFQPLNVVAKTIGIHPRQITRFFMAGTILMLALSVLLLAKDFVYICLSIIYPAYMTAKTVSNEPGISPDGKLLLSYWVCFGFLTMIDMTIGFLLHWIPFFHLARMFFIIWLYNRKTRGAEILNRKLLQPLVMKYGYVMQHFDQPKEPMVAEAQKRDEAKKNE